MTTSTASGGGEPRRGELKSLLTLAWPLIGNNLAIAGINFSDAVMAGRLSGVDLAAVAVGNSVWTLFFLAALGVLMALSPLVSHLYGARQYDRIGAYVRQGMVIAVALTVAISVALFTAVQPLLVAIGIDPEFRDIAIGYAEAIAWGTPAICVYLVLRFTLEGMGWTRPVLFFGVLALIINIIGNYVFIYGHFGAPRMGAVGCGVASAISMWIMCIGFLLFVWRSKRCRKLGIFERPVTPDTGIKREILALGVPIAANVVSEVGLFVGISLIMGTLSAIASAAHQIAINFASTMFMVPLAIASATTIRVGHALGDGHPEIARQRGFLGIVVCGSFMAVAALALLIFKDEIVSMYTTDPAVTSIATSLLLMAAIFTVSDGIQVGAAGALRGFKDTRVPLLMNLTAYWIVGFPLAYSAAQKTQPTPHMVWLGLVVGLSVAASLLVTRYVYLTRRKIQDKE